MNLSELILRGAPRPWQEGDNIPWNDPDFSQRMLKEHLTQDHDAASRRFETIDRHVQFIRQRVFGAQEGKPLRVLDLGCGPGLYSHRLAQFGYTVHGIDFSPASIAYARQVAESSGLRCTYTLGDVRSTPYPGDNDLVMFIYGEFNVFCPEDARSILMKAYDALRVGGRMLLEPHPADVIHKIGSEPATWYTVESGLFSNRPHLMLQESFWDEEAKVATNRYIVIDAATAHVTRYAASYQAYTHAEYNNLLEATGFSNIEFFPSLTGEDEGGNLIAIVAQK